MHNDEASDWSTAFNAIQENPPEPGAILVTIDGAPAKLSVEITEGQPPFIYGRIYVPEIVGAPLGWYLQGEEMESFHGWKCILMPRARADLIKKIGLSGETVMVQSLRLIRKSQTGKSFLCEVHQYVQPSDGADS